MWKLPDGTTVTLPRFVEIDGTRYNPQLFQDDHKWERDELGIIDIEEDGERTTEWVDTDHPEEFRCVRTYVQPATPSLDEVREQYIAAVKVQAGTLLAPTDWYITRYAETGTAIPAAISIFRAAVRAMSETLEAEAEAATSVEAIEAYRAGMMGRFPDAP